MGGTTTITNMGNWPAVETGQQSVTAAGTAEALNGGTSLEPAEGAATVVRADGDNAGNIYVGDANVDATSGFVLGGGESVAINIDDVASVYIDADNAGEGVSWLTETEA